MASITLYTTQDTYYGTSFSKGPNGSTSPGHVGGWGDQYYIFLQFDLSAIPAGSTITAATLTVTVAGAATISCVPIVKRKTSSWAEGTLTDTLGGDETPPAGGVGSPTWDAATNWGSFGWTNTNGAANAAIITSLVQGWFANTFSNFGLVIVPTVFNGGSNADTNVYMSEDATQSNRPVLVITYTPPTNIHFNNRGLRPAAFTPGRAR